MPQEMLTFPSLPSLSLEFFINRPALILVLVLFFIFYSIITTVLVYHWRAYGMKSKGILAAESLFFIVSIVLFATAGVSIFYL